MLKTAHFTIYGTQLFFQPREPGVLTRFCAPANDKLGKRTSGPSSHLFLGSVAGFVAPRTG